MEMPSSCAAEAVAVAGPRSATRVPRRRRSPRSRRRSPRGAQRSPVAPRLGLQRPCRLRRPDVRTAATASARAAAGWRLARLSPSCPRPVLDRVVPCRMQRGPLPPHRGVQRWARHAAATRGATSSWMAARAVPLQSPTSPGVMPPAPASGQRPGRHWTIRADESREAAECQRAAEPQGRSEPSRCRRPRDGQQGGARWSERLRPARILMKFLSFYREATPASIRRRWLTRSSSATLFQALCLGEPKQPEQRANFKVCPTQCVSSKPPLKGSFIERPVRAPNPTSGAFPPDF